MSLVGIIWLADGYRRLAKHLRLLRERLTGEAPSRGPAERGLSKPRPAVRPDRRRFEAPRDLAAAAAVVLALAVVAVLATVVLIGT